MGLEAVGDKKHLLVRREVEMSRVQEVEYSLDHHRVHRRPYLLRGSLPGALLFVAAAVSRGTFRHIAGALLDPHLHHLHLL